VITQNKLLSP